jgi:nucleoside-diphosphate-sugar epimerase
MSLHVILGKGPVGSTLTDRLVADGHDVRVLSRSGGRSTDRVEHLAVDASDAVALTAVARGAEVLYNCANPAYHRWVQEWPPMADALLDAAESSGAVLVTTGNLYVYGPVDRPLTEDLPLAATGAKGRVRVGMWEAASARHRAGTVRVTEARGSDFVGPRVVANGYLGERAVPRLLSGRAVQHIASPDQPHSWTAVDDVARTLQVLGADERAWGRAWHVPTAPPVTYRAAVHGLCRAAGVPPVRVTQLPHAVLLAAGLLSPQLRELEETRYQFTRPYVLDSSATTQAFGLEPTPWERTLADTVSWWRSRDAVRSG